MLRACAELTSKGWPVLATGHPFVVPLLRGHRCSALANALTPRRAVVGCRPGRQATGDDRRPGRPDAEARQDP
ncbi:hypothetical protein ASE27_19095 [Oerskovia sp. Root918]|nr:hypothetical protein ASE27_19095 [Oerskovia sp. Root918]